MAERQSNQRAVWLVCLLAFLLSVPSLNRAFYTRGEPREALVSQSMLATGNWISPPAYNGAVPSKPPFSHWLTALVSLPGGEVTESTARLPSAIAYLAFSLGLFIFLRHRAGEGVALVASSILLSSFEWLRSGSTCRVDTILATSMAGAMLALFAWNERGRSGIPWLALVLLCAAALTKGPVGVVLPLGLFCAYRLLSEGISVRSFFRCGLMAACIAPPVLGVVSAWYIAGYLTRGDEFLQKIWYENVERFASTMVDEPHSHSVFYLLGMLLVMILPWSGAWLLSAGRSRGAFVLLRSPRDWWRRASELERFSMLSALGIVLFFCVPSSKRSVYLLPAYPFIAILAGLWLERWESEARALLRGVACLTKGLAFLLPILSLTLVFLPDTFGVPWFPEAQRAAVGPIKLLCVVSALVLVWRLRGSGLAESAAVWVIACTAVAGVSVVDAGMMRISPKQWLASEDFQKAVNPAERERFYSFGSEAYAASFYLKKPFFGATRGIPSGSIVFVEPKNLERLKSELGSEVRELARYSSGLEGKRATLVVETVR